MTDSLGYKCLPLSEVPPVIRLSNEWPTLPPEESGYFEPYEWGAHFETIKELYNANVPFDNIIERLNIISSDTLRRKIQHWVKQGLLVKRGHPRNKWQPEYDEIVRARLLAGDGPALIAKDMGFSHGWMGATARRLGFVSERVGFFATKWTLDCPRDDVA